MTPRRTLIIHSLPSGLTHWSITGLREGKGIECPRCGAAHTRPCITNPRTNARMPRHEVHIERVRAMGL